MTSTSLTTILSLDGGGVRGLAAAQFLVRLEESLSGSGKIETLSDQFELVAGTSTGALMAAAIAKGDIASVSVIRDVYETEAAHILPRRKALVRALSPSSREAEFDHALGIYLGDDFPLAECSTPIVIPAVDKDMRVLHVFSSIESAESGAPITLKDAVLASSAAPMYLPSHAVRIGSGSRTFIDGGIAANNPSLIALKEARSRLGADRIRMLSIGTGSTHESRKTAKSKEQFDFDGRVGRRYGEELLDVFMQAQSHVADDLACDALGDGYLRIEPEFKGKLPSLDDSEEPSLKLIKKAGDELWRNEGQQVLEFLQAP